MDNITFVGLDVHNESITAAILANGAAGHREGHRGAEEVHQRVGAHVAVAVGPVEDELHLRADAGNGLALGRDVDHVLLRVIDGGEIGRAHV